MNTKQILDFLGGLSRNNSRDWMEGYKKIYLSAKSEFQDIVSTLISEISTFDGSISGADVKKCIFRLNRDIRFSKDKRPYKENFGAFISQEGRHSQRGGYYIHLQPSNKSMLAGGVYMPPPDILKKIRQEIDYNPGDLKRILSSKGFVKLFGDMEGEKLKTAPKGYSPDHPEIELLKYKSYIAVHNMNDSVVNKSNFIQYCIEIFQEMKPLNDYLRIAAS